MKKWIAVLGLTLFFSSGCDEVADPVMPAETGVQAIINGVTETGHPEIGALTLWYPGYGYQGSFCTATLIAPQWVLTAAHCLSESDGFVPTPEVVHFLVGNDARPNAQGMPTNGTLYATDLFYVHPAYDPTDATPSADIGLVHLSQPLGGVTPGVVNTNYLSSMGGTDVFYVGFGVTDGVTNVGGGLKRSTWMPIDSVGSEYYYSAWEGSGVCFGDSGGPGLALFSGVNKIIGVNSSVAGTGMDPCEGTSIQTRVDIYSAWIAGILGGTPPNCNTIPDLCLCPSACQATGSCDNDVCKTMACEDVYSCMVLCDTTDFGCQAECYAGGTSQATDDIDTLFGCMSDQCGTVPDAQFQTCVSDNCASEIATCFPISTGSLDCDAVYGCMVNCASGDQTCLMDCYENGTSTAQGQLDALFACMESECGSVSDDTYSECVYNNCAVEIATCMPPDNCDIAGGDCESGSACYPSTGGANSCFATNGLALGQACNPENTESLECSDGLVCIAMGDEEAECMHMCSADGDCLDDEACEMPLFTGIDDIGLCLCIDGDADGYCATADCNDGNSAVYPGAPELCDGVDNDCDNETDEGCPATCVDADEDGVCEQDDCDDSMTTVKPGAEELCDGIDNDCDSETDEGCPTSCVDADADGVCEEDDCDDSMASVNPAAQEVCDGLDNDCDTLVDEGCDVQEDVIEEPDAITSEDISTSEDLSAPGADVVSSDDTLDSDPVPAQSSSGDCTQGSRPTHAAWVLMLLVLVVLMPVRRWGMGSR